MNKKMMGRFMSQILMLEAVFMATSMIWCIIDREPKVIKSFLISVGIILAIGIPLRIICRNAQRGGFYAREGLLCVGIGWVLMSLLGCLPFFISGQIPNYIDALFEIVSGFTTTGATILTDVEAVSRALLYWRSFSHWLGGMGVLVFLLAIGTTGKRSGFTLHILRAESTGPDVSKLVPRMKKTASLLYFLYIALTVVNIIFLLAGKMSLFEALCTAYGTAGTGGFGVLNDSIAGYSPYIQNVCTVFMLLFGVNFGVWHLLFLRRIRAAFEDEELRVYFALVILATVLIAWNIAPQYASFGETLRHSVFQVASIITTTGFATTDFNLWPSFSKAILLILMVIGACAGSTGGGFKCGRAMIVIKNLARRIRQMLYPQRVQVIRINRQVVNEKVVSNTNAYLAAYVMILIMSWLIVSLDGFSFETNFTAVLSCVNNIGPGLDAVGPVSNFSQYSLLSKCVFILDMLAGRLEIFPILVLFVPSTWKKH